MEFMNNRRGRMKKKKVLNEVSVFIEILKANTRLFKLCQENLNTDEQKKVLYSISLELKNFCETCIKSFK